MINHMPEVAKMLGVELGEEFEIVFPEPCSCHATAMFTDEGVRIINTDVYDIYNFKAYVLRDLCTGAYGIKRKPWKPKEGESYYVVETNGSIGVEEWWSETMDMNYYKLGNCYRTREEAEANRDKWVAFYVSDEVLEV